MTDPRARRGLPERWLLPPAPRDADLAQRWREASFDERRAWARTSEAELSSRSERDAEMVVALARARLATSWRLVAAAPVLGWLVLMTVWGYGRSTYPNASESWLTAGLAIGAMVGAGVAVHVLRKLRGVTRMVGAADTDANPKP